MRVKEIYDFDAEWLFKNTKQARTVGDVLSRHDQYHNKIRALHKRYDKQHDLYHYGSCVDAFIKRLRTHNWSEQLVDVRRSDTFVRNLRV